MMILNFAFEPFSRFSKSLSWSAPRNVRLGSRIVSRQACDTGFDSDGVIAENTLRTRCGAVGARSGAFVSGLLHTPFVTALAERNERSSRKKTSAFLPQRKLRKRPVLAL